MDTNYCGSFSFKRSRSFKRPKYEKRKIPSISPVRHPSPSSIAHERRVSSPYHSERYMSSRPVVRQDHLEPPPAKKKIRREPDRFSQSPMRKSNDIPFISDSGLSMRSEIASRPPPMAMMSRSYMPPPVQSDRVERSFHGNARPRHSPPPVPSNLSKRPLPTLKNPYENAIAERYKSEGAGGVFPPPSDKSYAPTLNERFSSVETTHTEPRIRYSREDLEKITIDIRRNLRERSPTLRQIVNPNDVKLVRRADEGHRPIFDREEIKQAPRDMREDAYYEKKMTPGEGTYPAVHPMSSREVENYEITRHRFDAHHAQFHSSSGRSLSDRWQNPEVKKESASLDRDEREREYDRMHPKKNSVGRSTRSKSGDRDFRSERYGAGEVSRSRPDYHESQRRIVPIASESRGPVHHKDAPHPEIRRRLGIKRSGERESSPPVRSNSRSHFQPPPEKRYPEGISSRGKHPSLRRSPGLESHKWSQKSRSASREEKSEYSRRPEKYYKSWPDKREFSPPVPSYVEHGRESLDTYRGRGSSRSYRSSRGFRTRGFRGAPRGSFRSRGPFPGGYRGAPSPRGRGAPRRGRYSPSLWEHDMYSRLTPERK